MSISGSDHQIREIPFDLKTDRLLTYDANAPNASLNFLIGSLQTLISSEAEDSPVFLAIPQLAPVSGSRLHFVPASFRADLDAAEKMSATANLRLFAREILGLPWELEGLRQIARAQLKRASPRGALESWESVLRLDPSDREANLAVGTLYQREGRLEASDRALKAVLATARLSHADAAEALALLGSNHKERWHLEWEEFVRRDTDSQNNVSAAGSAALRSRYLLESLDRYSEALTRDLNSYYAAVNALALLTIRSELARLFPETWQDCFETEDDARAALARTDRQQAQMAALLEISLRHAEQSFADKTWTRLSQAELMLYTEPRATRVAAAYQRAVEGAPTFTIDSARRQLQALFDLGVLREKVDAVLRAIPTVASVAVNTIEALLFVGHTLDDPSRPSGRFPAAAEFNARLATANALKNLAAGNRPVHALAGGSAGADILFHELCLDFGIPATLCLPYPPAEYVLSSVQYAGSEWVGRFYGILKRLEPNVLVLANSAQIPAWLSDKPHYSVWQRNMHWMIAGSQEIGNDNVRLMALWTKSIGRDTAAFRTS